MKECVVLNVDIILEIIQQYINKVNAIIECHSQYVSDDVVGHNRSAVVVGSDVVMLTNVDLHKTVKRRRVHNDVTNENKDS